MASVLQYVYKKEYSYSYTYSYILYVTAHSANCIVATAVAVVDVVEVNDNIICVISQKRSGKLTKSYGDYEHLNKVTLRMKVQSFIDKPAVLCVNKNIIYLYM